MTHSQTLAGIVDGILAGLTHVHEWMVEMSEDMERCERRRSRLAQALDAAVSALEPADRAPYDRRVAELMGGTAVQTGRPPADRRYGTVLNLLAEWGEDSITTTDVNLEIRRRGMGGGRNYGSNLLSALTRRGIVTRTGQGRYRITRMHPQLVARRQKLAETR